MYAKKYWNQGSTSLQSFTLCNDIHVHVADCVIILPGGGAVWDEAERVRHPVYCGGG